LSRFLAIAIAIATIVIAVSCGGDIDLGGTSGAPCQPCASASSCKAGATCTLVSGDGYCATLCPRGDECGASETCANAPGADGGSTRACVPSAGICPMAMPPSIDGAAVERCGPLVGPNVSAACHACSKSSPTCQPNGCYGGYWCNTNANDCGPPPKTCA
jgi:hypothetical protein